MRCCAMDIRTYTITLYAYISYTILQRACTIFMAVMKSVKVPVAVRAKALVCGCSFAEIVGSNPAVRYACLSVVSVVCCQVEVSSTS
jgi:hypothetical protein